MADFGIASRRLRDVVRQIQTVHSFGRAGPGVVCGCVRKERAACDARAAAAAAGARGTTTPTTTAATTPCAAAAAPGADRG